MKIETTPGEVMEFLDVLFKWFHRLCPVNPQPTNEIKMNLTFKVKADHPDIPFDIDATVTDSEGNEIDGAEVNYEILSDNPEVAELALDDDSDPSTGKLHIGKPGIAAVGIKLTAGDIEQIAMATFVVSAGDPANLNITKIAFEGIEPEPMEPEDDDGEFMDGL